MARKPRVQFEGAYYHVTDRGNQRHSIFDDDTDRLRFLETLGQACDRYGMVVHGYCLMPNHYHLLVQTPRGNLSQAVGCNSLVVARAAGTLARILADRRDAAPN